MKIKLNGTLLESNNPFVIEQWKKAGYEEAEEERKTKRGKEAGKEPSLSD